MFSVVYSGGYMFMESSAPRKMGDKTWFVSQPFPAFTDATRCFNFWYHSYGDGIGESGLGGSINIGIIII